MRLAAAFFLAFLICISFADNITMEGGDITYVNASYGKQNSSWHGVAGQASLSAFSSLTILATPGNISYKTIGTGGSMCTEGIEILNILLSNSSDVIFNVSAGNLSVLEDFIGDPVQGAYATFTQNSSFTTASFGTLDFVPTTYTNSPLPETFKMGYLQDTAGNLVFIMPVVDDQPGFDGMLYDFQFMLPTRNSTPTNYYLSVDLKCKPPAGNGSGGGGAGGGGGGGGGGAASGGGGAAAGGGGGFSYTSIPSVDIEVNIGGGIICIVNVRRSLTVSQNYSVLITTLTNKGGPQCTMYDFVFQDIIPSDFAQIYEITFSPPYNSVKGSTVFFIFPVFAPGESRSLTYSVQRQIPQSRMQSFSVPIVLSANRGNPFLNLPPINQTLPPQTTPACVISIYCEPWSQCDEEGYRSQRCFDASNCTNIEFFNVEYCLPERPTQPEQPISLALLWRQFEKQICKDFPHLCVAEKPHYELLLLVLTLLFAALVALLILAGKKYLAGRRRELGAILEPLRPPVARKQIRIPEPETPVSDKSLELPDEHPPKEEQEDQTQKRPISRKPQWHRKGGLTIRPIFPEKKNN